jgi:hypothetical protein
MKPKQTLLHQYRKAQYHRNVCKYNGNQMEEKYWDGYVNALSLIIETQQ